MRERYELKESARLGLGPNDSKEVRMLSRIARWLDTGIEYDAGPRHAGELVAECCVADTNTVAIPGLRLSYDQPEKDDVLPAHLLTEFRARLRARYVPTQPFAHDARQFAIC